MKEKKQEERREESLARAFSRDLPVSTKQCVEICSYLRYKRTNEAKKILEEVIGLRKAIPFKKFKMNIGHKAGMAAGRFPQKAAKEMLRLIKSAEANAQFKGLNTANLKITKILANKASIPVTGGRRRTKTKRTHLEIEVKEVKEKQLAKKEKKKGKQEEKKMI